MAKKNNTKLILILAAIGIALYFYSPDIFQLQSAVGLTRIGSYEMVSDGVTWELKMQGTDDYWRVLCDDDPISYKAAQDVEKTVKNSFGCYEYRYHKAEAYCSCDNIVTSLCHDRCEMGPYPAYYALESKTNICDGTRYSYDSYCRKSDLEIVPFEEWTYDNGISWTNIDDNPAAWFEIFKNGKSVQYFGKSTWHPEEWLKNYIREDRDMERRNTLIYKENGKRVATIENINYEYGSGTTECYDRVTVNRCILSGIYHGESKDMDHDGEIIKGDSPDLWDGKEICLTYDAEDPTEKYHTETVCAKSGRWYKITGDFIVGDSVLHFCQGQNLECSEIAKANDGNNYYKTCTNKCLSYQVLDDTSCSCIDRSNFETREADIGYGREGGSESLIIDPGENVTLIVAVDVGEFDAERPFEIELDANATEYNYVTGTVGSTQVTELYSWVAEDIS